MALKLIGKKKGMTQIFDKDGNAVPCTVVLVETNRVCQVKTKERDGYEAVQLAGVKMRHSDKAKKPIKGHFSKAQVEPCNVLRETRVESSSAYQVGQEVKVSQFAVGDYVDVMGVSKGKGYQGVMKLHGFRGMPGAHGAGPVHRHAGSTGMRTTPGRCFPGGKRASHMGNVRKTVQSLKVVLVDEQKGLILLKGAIPGHREGVVYLSKATKKSK